MTEGTRLSAHQGGYRPNLSPAPRLTEGRAVSPSRGSVGRLARPAGWLAISMSALAILSAASATVSYAAQYRLVNDAKRLAAVAVLEAAIPDVAALIFAALGIALALYGKRALRPRLLNLCAVGTSITMNVLAAGQGWRDLAIWVMPPVAYALASDTAIGVVRAWTIARQRALNSALADDGATPLAIIGGLLFWMLRLLLAPGSTLGGFRRWVIEECPVAPGRRAPSVRPDAKQIASGRHSAATARPDRPTARNRSTTAGAPTKTQRFLDLVVGRYGPLSNFPVADVSKVCSELAPEVDLNAGAARTALRRHVLAAQNGSSS